MEVHGQARVSATQRSCCLSHERYFHQLQWISPSGFQSQDIHFRSGLCFVITMSIVLVLNSKRPAFRFASVTFLSIYLVGAGLGFMGLVFYNIGTNSLAMCTVSLWFVSVGTFMIYSAMVVKNVRIYVIFLGTQMGSWTSDGTLLVAVLLLNLANGAILVAFQIATPYEQSVYITDGEVWPICASPQSSSWQWILLSPFLVLILLGLYLSIQTRDVKSEFNESGLINRSIYITTLTLSVLIPLNMTLKLPSTIRSITTLIISLTLFTVIGMNFIPKIMATTENQSRIKEFVSEERRKTSIRNSSIIKSTSSKV
ncbi:hypothetical protein BCR33DRAFT_362538 [Rhizoclosmatium globosum]|uniref:G-protein coupled receptors family 3 profile domain-containing protein n=1 Tax=Rhizoclosmatium globosum TaxID=329046 RepID=A0A1Y2C0A6_9FUNG|nr:hypothetical protein BCR33DRAFT_362538 [Rhizoclosmatium globosum]|eukprot:ORY40344.1 hypothetical protein BCR33DRAFT_362538 [Rhizoclosmatium globosum]